MRTLTETIVWVWSKDHGIEQLAFPGQTEAWGWCSEHPNDWLRIDKVITTVIFDRQDPLGLDEGPPEPIKKEDHNGSARLPEPAHGMDGPGEIRPADRNA